MTAFMVLKVQIWLFVVMLILLSCQKNEDHREVYSDGTFRIWLDRRNDSLSVVYLQEKGSLSDSLLLPYPVYRFCCADLSGDGIPEICVGVEKATRYWHREDRRLFIYHLWHGKYIRPLWLGSRVGNRLVDFDICSDSVPARILSTEMRSDSTLLQALYKLQGFGLKFERYLDDE